MNNQTNTAKALVGENICKKYGKQEVLKNLNVTIVPNCIYGLIGRNGVGKTTLLGILTAQNFANSGNISYGGEKVWENRNALSQICFSRELNAVNVSANGAQNTFKVRDYLEAGKIYYPNWDKNMANELIEKFHLDKKKHVRKLSKGQLSMITIIIALASKCPVTILDEPTAGLDVIARDKFYKLLLEEYTETQRTFVISTHIIEEAASVFERVLIMNKGQIIEDKPTEELLDEFRFVSGSEDLLAPIFAKLPNVEALSTQSLGKHKMIAIRGTSEDFNALEQSGISVERMTLQNVFIALCGEE